MKVDMVGVAKNVKKYHDMLPTDVGDNVENIGALASLVGYLMGDYLKRAMPTSSREKQTLVATEALRDISKPMASAAVVAISGQSIESMISHAESWSSDG